MSRHEERTLIFKLLYEYTFYPGEDTEAFISSREEISGEKYSDFIKKTFAGTIEAIDDIDAVVSESSVGWKVSRMSKVTVSILRLAVYELKYTKTPPKAVINEAVELAKEFDDEKAASFINGILNRVARNCGLLGDGNRPE